MSSRRIAGVAGAALMVVAAPVVAYWLIGDLSSKGFASDQLNYYWHPPGWTPKSIQTTGIIAASSSASVPPS